MLKEPHFNIFGKTIEHFFTINQDWHDIMRFEHSALNKNSNPFILLKLQYNY